MSAPSGALLLLPTLLGHCPPQRVLPAETLALARATTIFLAENAKSARAFLKAIAHPQPIAGLAVTEVGHSPDPRHFDRWLAPTFGGHDVALLSEAGCPAVADPGAALVARAHELGVRVRPLVGPSSVLLALMAAGMNGQRFRFVGYLPQDRQALIAAIGQLEAASRGAETQLFIETPYRSERMLQTLLEHGRHDTRLAVAVDLTTDSESVLSLPISGWRALPPQAMPALRRRPAVFALLSATVQPSGRGSGRTPGSGRQ
ncbi:MAG: SAM-dependent methyltransferase [Burkholderiales bacterium]|jgi:16S rRNA (cytidine1402-2'-O)-methyltransferase|nr:MAG: SAM-dependent methyltransferase [Burkholderiales bacterium]